MKVPPSRFKDNFVEINGIGQAGFADWVFSPGMLFGSEEKWWATGGRRKSRHEGIDLRLYRDQKGEEHYLDEKILISVMYGGEVVMIVDDFMGKSIFLGHNIHLGKKRLFSIYGHLIPFESIRTGGVLTAKSVLGHLAKTTRPLAIPEHLHLSVAVIPESFPSERLDWDILKEEKEVLLLDPLPIISN